MARKTAKRSARKVVRRSARKVARRSARRSARKVRRSARRYRANLYYAKGSNDDVTVVPDPLRRPISRGRMPYRPTDDIPTFNDGRDILAEYDARYRREKAPAMVPPPEFLRPRRVEVAQDDQDDQDDQVEEKGLLSRAVDAVKGFFSRPARHPHVMRHSPVTRRSPVRQLRS